MNESPRTKAPEYTQVLLGQRAIWKRVLDVQAPYRWHIKNLKLGRVLEVGCGIGRNLTNLGNDFPHCGVDHNKESVAIAKSYGLNAMLVDDFLASPLAVANGFDTLLLSHLIEHLTEEQARILILDYLQYIKPNGRIIIITPQEWGQRADPTHITFFNHEKTRALLKSINIPDIKQYSFPLPSFFGKLFRYNEYVCIAQLNTSMAALN